MTGHPVPAAAQLAALDRIPRVPLVLGPTPLHPAPRLSAELGVPILFKRDDLTGAGLGGNKLRGLEYILADVRAHGCDALVTGAGPQSNWTVLAALACLRHQVTPYVISYGPAIAATGNLVLHQRLGTDVRFTGDPEKTSVDVAIETVTQELRVSGHRPYPVPRGGATPLSALGYVRASAELAAQLAGPDTQPGASPAALWLATGSCGTQAGLVAGAAMIAAAAGTCWKVTGVTVSRPAEEAADRVRALAAAAAALADLDVPIAEPDVRGGWIGPGYGVPSAAGEAAARLVAVTEGVFLDPVFGAKAMAALIAACRGGQARGVQVFLVSGGAPALFAGLDAPADRPGEAWGIGQLREEGT